MRNETKRNDMDGAKASCLGKKNVLGDDEILNGRGRVSNCRRTLVGIPASGWTGLQSMFCCSTNTIKSSCQDGMIRYSEIIRLMERKGFWGILIRGTPTEFRIELHGQCLDLTSTLIITVSDLKEHWIVY